MAAKNKPLKPCSQRKYVKNSANCPFCNSQNIGGDGIEVDGEGASQRIECSDCGGVWLDCYKLTGFEIVTAPEPKVTCCICHQPCNAKTAHIHQDEWIGDECCWDERLRGSE